MLAFAAGSQYERFVLLATNAAQVVDVSEFAFSSAADYIVWSEYFGTSLTMKPGTVATPTKTATQFEITVAAAFNGLTVPVWIITTGGKQRTRVP